MAAAAHQLAALQNETLAAQQRLQAAQNETDALQQRQLRAAMMYWHHARPIPLPSARAFFPAANETQYITWEQDFAGMNNARLQLENLVLMAHAFRRTLVMPGHLLNHLDDPRRGGGYVRASHVFDFKALGRWIPIITMQQYLDTRGVPKSDSRRTNTAALIAFLRQSNGTGIARPKWDPNGQCIPIPSREAAEASRNVTGHHSGAGASGAARRRPSFHEFCAGHPVVTYSPELQQTNTLHISMDYANGFRLFGHNIGFWYWPTLEWQDYYMAGLRDHLHFRPDIFANASRVAHIIQQRAAASNKNGGGGGGGKVWAAVHDRTGDFQAQFGDTFFVQPAALKDHLTQALAMLPPDVPVYVAAEPWNDTRFGPVKRRFPNVRWLTAVVADVLPGLPPAFAGPIEQVVCSVATRFVGTYGSTFTAYIHRMRGHHSAELVPDKDLLYTNWPKTPEAYAAAVADNAAQRDGVWYPDERGRPGMFAGQGTWAKAFSATWDFLWGDSSDNDVVHR